MASAKRVKVYQQEDTRPAPLTNDRPRAEADPYNRDPAKVWDPGPAITYDHGTDNG